MADWDEVHYDFSADAREKQRWVYTRDGVLKRKHTATEPQCADERYE